MRYCKEKYYKRSILFIFCYFCFKNSYSNELITQQIESWHFKYFQEEVTEITNNEDYRTWEIIKTPHCFNTSETYKMHKEGIGVYVTEICLEKDFIDDWILSFEGICLNSSIYINGIKIDINQFPYLPFKCNINAFIKNGNNIIMIHVDNRFRKLSIPDINCNGWWIYGGLIREVKIEKCKKNRIENIQIRTICETENRFKIIFSFDTIYSNPDNIEIEIYNGKKREWVIKIEDNDKKCFYDTIINRAIPWSPENPFLYSFKVIPFWNGVKGQTISFKKGFAQLKNKSGKITLNNNQIFLCGVGRHDVLDIKKGPLMSRKERRADLVEIKKLGANMLRIAHFPQHRDIYELSDSLGLIVMDEIPAWKTAPSTLGDSVGQAYALSYLEKLINAHGNFTSIGIWCIGNEIMSLDKRVIKYIKKATEFCRIKDSVRLVTFTSFFYQFDKAKEYCDVIAVNEYFGWFLGSVDMLTGMMNAIKKDCPDKPIIVTEFGASSILGKRNDRPVLAGPVKSVFTKDYSEDYQALLIKEQIDLMWENRNICSGAVVWSYNDFRENRRSNDIDDIDVNLNCMGLVTENRNKKLSYSIVKNKFQNITNSIRDSANVWK